MDGVIHKKAGTRQWKPTPYAGVEICGLRRNETDGGAVLIRIARGARFPSHDHPGGEELYVVSGRAVIGDATVAAGDYLWTPPRGIHELRAEEDTVLFVTSLNGIRVVD
jgi:quercetin dioxygenase-like cupin family protein